MGVVNLPRAISAPRAPGRVWATSANLRSCLSEIKRNIEMPVFQSPGLADQGVNEAALAAWNARVQTLFNDYDVSPFLVLDPRDIEDTQTSDEFKWSGSPRELLDCLGAELAERVSDLGWSSRVELHNEYLEYALVMRPDLTGRMRPKRFVATTELMEWWMTMAVHDLEHFLHVVASITRCAYSAQELFGVTGEDWKALDISARVACFHQRLVGAGRAQPPEHPINLESVLFMSSGRNSLSDLTSVMHFGSFPYLVLQEGQSRRARLDEIFTHANRQDLFCRSALSTVAKGAYDLALVEGSVPPKGRAMAFADPLGMYIRSFQSSDLLHDEKNAPNEWVRFSRGVEGMPMRLEFGPSDDDPRFLDEVCLGAGVTTHPVSGYSLASWSEVGPLVKTAATSRPITKVELSEIPAAEPDGIVCGLPGTQRCRQISEFADQCENASRRNEKALKQRNN